MPRPAGGNPDGAAAYIERQPHTAASRFLVALLIFSTILASPLGGACGSIWLDGGFEATAPDPVTGKLENPNYAASSTTYGTPLCDIAHCGNGSDGSGPATAGPRSGTYWAFFGGVPAGTAETSSVAQPIVIPSGVPHVTLRYYLWIGAVEAPFTDTLQIQVDSVTQQTITEPSAAETGYTLRSVDLTAFADGASHTITFLYTQSSSSGTANFNVDDITLDAGCPAVKFYSLTPCRVIDTRSTNSPALAAGSDRTFTFTGQCSIPATAKSVALNVAVTQPTTGPGFLTLFAGGTTRPPTATINYSSGQTRANNAVIPLGAAGDITVHCGQGSGTVQAIIDVNGYFQ